MENGHRSYPANTPALFVSTALKLLVSDCCSKGSFGLEGGGFGYASFQRGLVCVTVTLPLSVGIIDFPLFLVASLLLVAFRVFVSTGVLPRALG